jgi:hypothetical protein
VREEELERLRVRKEELDRKIYALNRDQHILMGAFRNLQQEYSKLNSVNLIERSESMSMSSEDNVTKTSSTLSWPMHQISKLMW